MAWSDGLSVGTATYNIAADTNPRIRVLAGPGTGKSFAMKRRVARLLESGVAPGQILPVTFTRVAAQDLHRELVSMGVPGCASLKAYTLHSLALGMLMRNSVLASTGRVPRPLNRFEADAMTCDLMGAHGGKKAARSLQQAYESAWARLNHSVPGYAPTPQELSFETDLIAWLRFHAAMLIGEVVPQLYRYLSANPAAPERQEFGHILVDEYQDLNKAEQSVIELLSGLANVCIVGDDDQSIYSFKYAHPVGIRDWVKANPGAADIALLDCHRCPSTVVNMANALIAHNTLRPVPRNLVPLASKGAGDVRIWQFANLVDEVAGVASEVENMVASGVPPGEILILAQSRAVGNPIYEALLSKGIPTESEYTESELEKEESQWAFALLKLFADRNDRVALRWLVGFSGNNFHASGYARVRAHCETSGLSPWEAFVQLQSGLLKLPHTKSITKAFSEVQAELVKLDALPNISSAIDSLFPAGKAETSELRRISLELLANDPAITAKGLVEELVAEITQPEIPTQVTVVRVMSLHKSKGLSSPVTFIAGCVNGLLPRSPSDTLTPAEATEYAEEQRRLFFVGITRVKADPPNGKVGKLTISYSTMMPMADALQAGITPAHVSYGVAHLHASNFISDMAPAAPAAIKK
jgi:DNA helicase-2/ATP-dependent DNA helicase PcrA